MVGKETYSDPEIDFQFQADLPQVPPTELDTEQQVILFSIEGNYFNRVDPIIKSQFPELIKIANKLTKQVRLVATTNKDGSNITFTAWNKKKHGEFTDIPSCSLTPQEFQDLLEETGLDLDPSQNSQAESNQLRNVRKKGASTKVVSH